MRVKTPMSLLAALALAFGVLCTPAGAADAEDATQTQAKQCLACHGGSLEALQAKTKDYKDEFGDPVQPHVYIDGKSSKPHQGAKVLPDCVGCHGKHPIPRPKDYQPKKPTFDSCYGCHHIEKFTKCSECHDK